MLRRRFVWAAVVSLGVLMALGWFERRSVSRPAAEGSRPGRLISETFSTLPLGFELNEGQFDPRVLYAAHTSDGTLFFSDDGLTLALPQFAPRPPPSPDPRARLHRHPALQSVTGLRLAFDGANPTPEVAATDQQPGIKNYLIGRDPEKWHTHVPIFGKLAYRNLYPGIDLVFYGGKSGLLEYDLNVSPGANTDRIRFRFEGADRVELDDGDLLIHAGPAELRQPRPHVFASASNPGREVPVSYRIDGQGWIGLDVPKRDARDGLRIDPVLAYSTYLGGSGAGDDGDSIAVDLAGAVYVAGQATSIDFPTTNGGLQPHDPQGGVPKANFAVSTVTKLDPAGAALVYSTYIGSAIPDSGVGDSAEQIVVTDGGLAYVVGQTGAPDFPVTPEAAQMTFGGSQDGYLLELGPAGDQLIYCTFAGGSDIDVLDALDLDAEGNAYAGGFTNGSHFPTVNALQPSYGGGPNGNGIFVMLSADGKQFLSESYLGGSGSGAYPESVDGIKVDADGQALVLGYTVSSDIPGHALSPYPFHDGGGGTDYLTRLTSDGQHQIFFTYLGGSGIDFGWDLKVDALGNTWVVGQTGSADYPVTSNAIQKSLANPPTNDGSGPFDAFITVLDPDGGLLYSTYLGGNGDDRALGVALDAQGHAHISGITTSTDLDTIDAIRGEHDESLGLDQAQGNGDMFLGDLTVDGGLDFLSYIGGSGSEFFVLGQIGIVAVDSAGATYFVGSSASTDFPVTTHAFQTKNDAPAGVANMVVVKVVPTPPPSTLTSLQPDVGPSVGGFVYAQGTNLSLQCALDFGGTPSVNISATQSQLQVNVQPHACGPVDVTLSCPGSPLFTLPDGFTFEGCLDSGPPDAGPASDAGPVPDAGSPERPASGCGFGASTLPDSAGWILGLSLLAMARRRRAR